DDDLETVLTILKNNKISPCSLLELGVGTGLMADFMTSHGYMCCGVDSSPEMLAKARQRNDNIRLLLSDMLTVDLKEKFSLILCVFDTINHLASLADWESLFEVVLRHMTPDGTFLFDFNTETKLQMLANVGRLYESRGNSFALFRFKDLGEGKLEWDVSYHQLRNNFYCVTRSIIMERAYHYTIILDALSKKFGKISCYNDAGQIVGNAD
ncbi:9217_t:CDS:1, partial [Racocetra fulgida]